MRIAAILSLLLAAGCTYAAKEPNIVVILTDDMGYGDIGAYGGTRIKTPNIDSLAARVSRQYKISVGELCSGSRRQRVVQARAVLSWVGVRELGYSGAEVARYLGVTNSCVTRIAASDTRPPVEELIEAL